MRSEFSSGVVPQKMRVFTRGGVAILLATTSIGLMYGATARAEDAAMLQKLEAQIQRLEERHQSEIKALRAEIRQLRRQKPPTSVAATQASVAPEAPNEVGASMHGQDCSRRPAPA